MEDLSKFVAQQILALQEPGEMDSEFADRVGLTRQTVSNYKHNRHGASLEALRTVAEQTGVSYRWLITGEGPRVRPDTPEEAQVRLEEIRRVLDAGVGGLRSEQVSGKVERARGTGKVAGEPGDGEPGLRRQERSEA